MATDFEGCGYSLLVLQRTRHHILLYHLNVSTEIETHQTRLHFSSLQQSPILVSSICSGDEWYPVGSSAVVVVVAHLPQGCACCGFTNALLHTLVV